MSKPTTKLRKTMCATCPWRKGSPYAFLKETLKESALTQRNRICHCTGSSAIHRRTGKPEAVCRGARQEQLQHFHKLGVIEAPPDEAWAKARERCGLPVEELV